MKRTLILIFVLAVYTAAPASAQLRLELGALVPVTLGFQFTDVDTGEQFGDSENILGQILIILPEIALSYAGRFGPFALGGGLRGFTFILQTVGYPYLFTEFEFGPVIGSFAVGGIAFPYFGIVNGIGTPGVVIPDLSAYLKVGETFRIGGGATALLGLETGTNAFPYLFYLSGKFVFDL